MSVSFAVVQTVLIQNDSISGLIFLLSSLSFFSWKTSLSRMDARRPPAKVDRPEKLVQTLKPTAGKAVRRRM
jgi:hypothetical protein